MPCCIGLANPTWCPGRTTHKPIPPLKKPLKNQLPDRLAATQAAHPDRQVELWFQDEARFGQQGSNSRLWADTGSRPSAPRQTEYGFVYLFGAVCPATGQSNGWLMPRANTQTMQGQLDGLSRALAPHVHALLVLDGAGWHRSAALVIPGNLTLLHLPAYSPELNPAERLWRELRQRHLSNRVYAGIEALDEGVATAWLALTRDVGRLMKLTHFPWIQSAQTQGNLGSGTF